MKAAALFDVHGLSVMVTGAASGIGLGYAEVMATNGANVTLVDVDGDALHGAVERLRAGGGHVAGEVADVTQPDTLRRAVAGVEAREGRLDVLFANAGISAGPGFLMADGTRNEAAALENLSLDTFDRTLAVNLRGALVTLQASVPTMKRQGGGRIIVTTTVSLIRTETLVSTLYVASKAALGQLVRQAALELAAYGILVNGIAPRPDDHRHRWRTASRSQCACAIRAGEPATPNRYPRRPHGRGAVPCLAGFGVHHRHADRGGWRRVPRHILTLTPSCCAAGTS